MEEFQNVLGFITAIRYLLLRHPLLLVPSPGLSSPSSDVSCSNLLEACPSDSRGFASFPCDFACSYIPVSDIPLFHGPKFCNNDTISNSVCFSSRPVRFPYHSVDCAARCLHWTFHANHADCYRFGNFSIFSLHFFEMEFWITWCFSRVVRCV